MKNQVKTYRDAGLEARWTKRNGTPFIAVRDPKAQSDHQRNTWWIVDRGMFDRMKKHGVRAGFDQSTVLGNFFSI